MMTRTNLVGMSLAVLAAGAVLAGCGSTGHDMNNMGQPGSSTAAASGQQGDHNQADVAFAQQMIPHHSQALEMATMVPGHDASAKVTSLAGRIDKAQGPEIAQMTGWLKSWGAAPASTGMNMPGMDQGSKPGMSGGPSAPGMMSADEMKMLGQAKGAAFDRRWLQMMIQHHQGAIDMASTELKQGSSADGKALAQKITAGQQAEITEMKGILGNG